MAKSTNIHGALTVEKEVTIEQLAGSLGWETDGPTQTVPAGSRTKVGWTQERFEDREIVSLSVQDDEITIDKPGLYSVKGFVNWESDEGWSTGDRLYTNVRVNDTYATFYDLPKIGTERQSSPFYHTEHLNQGDVISVDVQQESGDDKYLNSDSSISDGFAQFNVLRLG